MMFPLISFHPLLNDCGTYFWTFSSIVVPSFASTLYAYVCFAWIAGLPSLSRVNVDDVSFFGSALQVFSGTVDPTEAENPEFPSVMTTIANRSKPLDVLCCMRAPFLMSRDTPELREFVFRKESDSVPKFSAVSNRRCGHVQGKFKKQAPSSSRTIAISEMCLREFVSSHAVHLSCSTLFGVCTTCL